MTETQLQNLLNDMMKTLVGGLVSGGAVWKWLDYRNAREKSEAERRDNQLKIQGEIDDKLLGRYKELVDEQQEDIAALKLELRTAAEQIRNLQQTNTEQYIQIQTLTRRVAELERVNGGGKT